MDSGRLLARPSGAQRRSVRTRITLVTAIAILVIAVLASLRGSNHHGLPLPGIGRPARAGDPLAYIPSLKSDFVNRAVAGSSHVLFVKSPGGVMATAARVA